jgi:NAD(P)-dependent dehydrogenase (short-subunit alcohol dehydrogenase family)
VKRALAAGIGLAVARAAWRRTRALDLSGKVVLVTGGSRGLGFALAEEFAAHGARVSICARGEEALERARTRLVARGADVHAFRCDVADRAQVEAWVAEATARFGRVDVLVNNAGVISVGALQTQRVEDFAEVMDIHLWGTLYPTLAVLPGMLARGEGRIANITSIGGKVSVPLLVPYSASKFAAVGLSEGLRAELAPKGVLVTTVVPGLMRTGSYLAAYFKEPQQLTYSLFTPISATPLTTISARRAARKIVNAVRHGDPELILTAHANLVVRATGLAPGTMSRVLALVARVLPEGTRPEKLRGAEIASPIDESFVTALGRKAAADYNQR